MVIAIDGPAGSGKSSIAKLLAEKLGFVYINSGNLYRAVTLRIMNLGVDIADTTAMTLCAADADIRYCGRRLNLDGVDVEDMLHSSKVDAIVAQVSSIPGLRDIVNCHVRKMASMGDVVAEGRDMTTIVFPDAQFKFFLDASIEARASRRLSQGTSGIDYHKIVENIRMRDEIDRTKSVGSLKIAADAEYLDSSDLTMDQVYEKVYMKILHQRELYGH